MDLSTKLQKKIYIPLLNEGTDVLRPVMASEEENNHYIIIGTEQGFSPEDLDEEWAFPIGSCVICRIEKDENMKEILVADSFCK